MQPFQINDVPEGVYTVDVSAQGFAPLHQQLTVTSNNAPVLHFPLELAPVSSSIEVLGSTSRLNPQTSTVQTLVATQEIAQAVAG
jgi:hypothetical protein